LVTTKCESKEDNGSDENNDGRYEAPRIGSKRAEIEAGILAMIDEYSGAIRGKRGSNGFWDFVRALCPEKKCGKEKRPEREKHSHCLCCSYQIVCATLHAL
jgi:hypothetical protein